MNGNSNVFYVGGSKGGVGKSLFTFVLVNYFLEKNSNILFVDSEIIKAAARIAPRPPASVRQHGWLRLHRAWRLVAMRGPGGRHTPHMPYRPLEVI